MNIVYYDSVKSISQCRWVRISYSWILSLCGPSRSLSPATSRVHRTLKHILKDTHKLEIGSRNPSFKLESFRLHIGSDYQIKDFCKHLFRSIMVLLSLSLMNGHLMLHLSPLPGTLQMGIMYPSRLEWMAAQNMLTARCEVNECLSYQR